jgi:hypothetical protein
LYAHELEYIADPDLALETSPSNISYGYASRSWEFCGIESRGAWRGS